MLDGLQPTRGEPLPFADTIHIRAFTLANGLVVYAAPGVEGSARAQYLNHWHEATFGEGFADAPLLIHEADAPFVDVPVTTFSAADSLDDFQLIPIPGHTPGSTAYLWDNGEHRVLFTADTIMLRGGEWRAAVLASSDRATYLASLALLRDLDFDVLVPWVAAGAFHAVTDRADARRRIGAIIDRVSRGASG